MVDVTTKYHLESLPDGQQVLVDDRGNVAITDPNTGTIVGVVSKPDYIAYRGGGTATGPVKPSNAIVTPKAAGGTAGVSTPRPLGPVQYPPGVTNTPTPTGGGIPPYVPGGQTPSASAAAATPGAATPTAPASTTGRPAVGAAGYDLWGMNDMLIDNGYNGWQVTGYTPIQEVDQVKNPDYDPDLQIGSPTIAQPKNSYIINIRRGDDIKTVKFAKVHETSPGSGVFAAGDPGPGNEYRYQLNDIIDQQKSDPNKVGHSGTMQIGDTLWGTNNATGAFEPVPGAPKLPKGWTNITQAKTPDGSTAWFGIDPADGKPKQIPDMPIIPKQLEAWGDPELIDRGDGTKVWYGTDPTDKVRKPMPNMPVVPKPPTGPSSITGADKVVYVQKPDGSYEPAKGVPNPNPPKGTQQVILGSDGYLYRQTSRGDGTFDPDPSFEPVPYSDAAKQARANIGATHKKGEPGTKVIGGKVYHVTYRGDSQDSYDVDTSIPATTMPGTATTTSIATGTDQPYIVQRTDGSATPTTIANPNYQPTDPARRVAQLSDQATSKLAELQAQVQQGTVTQDQAQSQYDKWWNDTIEPAKTQLQFDQRKQQEDLQRTNLATAQTGASDVLRAVQTTAAPGNSPAYAAALGAVLKGTKGAPQGVDYAAALSAPAPNYADVYDQATARALAHISPTAAQKATGNPTPGMFQQGPIDITAGLNPTRYQLQAGAPPPQAQPRMETMPATTGAPPQQMQPLLATMGQPVNFDLLYQRLRADQAQQGIQAQAWPYVPPI